jgi:hypothetical protein
MKSSELTTEAHDRKTVMLIAEKAVFFHSEFGMRAGLPRACCRLIQKTNPTRSVMATDIMMRVLACHRDLGSSARTLLKVQQQLRSLNARSTYVHVYEMSPKAALAMKRPIQSMVDTRAVNDESSRGGFAGKHKRLQINRKINTPVQT